MIIPSLLFTPKTTIWNFFTHLYNPANWPSSCCGERLTLDPFLVKDAILTARSKGLLDPVFCDALLHQGDDDDDEIMKFEIDDIPFHGLPQRPLYHTLTTYLRVILEKSEDQHLLSDNVLSEQPINIWMPASDFGLQEIVPSIAPLEKAAMKKSTLVEWLHQTGRRGILYCLGLRHTVGTVLALPPNAAVLLQAAAALHHRSNALSVAARARAKHAHRAAQERSFFGVAQGSAEQQTQDTHQILQRMLIEAVWMNIHSFGGMNGQPVLEIRVESGYGARWSGELRHNSPFLTNVVFRGFLEPQMENGHERKWRH